MSEGRASTLGLWVGVRCLIQGDPFLAEEQTMLLPLLFCADFLLFFVCFGGKTNGSGRLAYPLIFFN